MLCAKAPRGFAARHLEEACGPSGQEVGAEAPGGGSRLLRRMHSLKSFSLKHRAHSHGSSPSLHPSTPAPGPQTGRVAPWRRASFSGYPGEMGGGAFVMKVEIKPLESFKHKLEPFRQPLADGGSGGDPPAAPAYGAAPGGRPWPTASNITGAAEGAACGPQSSAASSARSSGSTPLLELPRGKLSLSPTAPARPRAFPRRKSPPGPEDLSEPPERQVDGLVSPRTRGLRGFTTWLHAVVGKQMAAAAVGA